MAESVEAGIYIFPAEIWIQIVKKVDNIDDVENLNLAFVDLRPILDFHLTKLKTNMVILLLLRNGFINIKTGLKMREVSKDWCNVLDSFYNKPHVSSTCLPPSYFPCVTLKVPLDMNGRTRVQDFVKYENCKFIGGRLTLLVSSGTGPRSQIDNGTLQSLCARVEHLTIAGGPNDAFDNYHGYGLLIYLGTFAEKMCNLTSIAFKLGYGMETGLILYLPNPEKLDYIRTGYTQIYSSHDYRDNWKHAFAGCSSNLKIFDCQSYTMGMQWALSHLQFDNLLEFRADDELWRHHGTSHLYSLNAADAKLRFPRLKRIAIPFFDGDHGIFTKEDEWDFLERLIQVTNNLDTIEEIELRASFNFHIKTSEDKTVCREVPLQVRGSGSSAVRRLVLDTGFHNGDYDEIDWCFRLTQIWPSVHSLRIGRLEYVKKLYEWRTV